MLIRGFSLSYVVDAKHLYLMIIAVFWNAHFIVDLFWNEWRFGDG